MKLYGIRRKSDGFMMPAGRSQGFTHDEPKDPCLNPPRLFTKKQYAETALSHWVAGEYVTSYYADGENSGYDIKRKLDRIPEDMEVVTVYLRVKK